MRITLPSGTAAELVTNTAPTQGVVLWPDIMGLRPLFDEMARRLSDDNGWTVCVPEMFPGQTELTLDERLSTGARDLDDQLKQRDAAEAAEATGCERVSVIGFCMGGMYAMKSMSTGRFARAAAFYGMVRTPENWVAAGRRDALEHVVDSDPASVILIAGTSDPWIPPADLDALEATGATVVRYDGADHGFIHDPSRPTHRPDDAADAWRRVIEFIEG